MAQPQPSPGTGRGFPVRELVAMVETATEKAKTKLKELQESSGGDISITTMFEMQMEMNVLSQLSEVATSVVAASHQAITKMASVMRQ